MKSYFLIIFAFIPLLAISQDQDQTQQLQTPLQAEQDLFRRYSLAQKLVGIFLNQNSQQALAYANTLGQIAEEVRSDSLQQLADYHRAAVYRRLGRFEEALALLKPYIAHVREVKDTAQLIRALGQVGANYIRLGQHINAQTNLLEALALAEETQAQSFISQLCNSIGVNFRLIAQPDKAKPYLIKAVQVAEELNDLNSQVIALNGLGLIYRDQDSLAKAKSIFEQALKVSEEAGFLRGVANHSRNLGTIAQKMEDYDLAESYFRKAFGLREEIGAPVQIAGSYYDLGHVFLAQKKLDEAEMMLKEAERRFKELKVWDGESEVFRLLSYLYELRNDAPMARSYIIKHAELQDSLRSETLKAKVLEMEEKFQAGQKEKALLSTQLALEQSKRRNLLLFAAVILVLFMAGGLVWAYWRSQQEKQRTLLAMKQRYQLESLESLLEGEEKERHRLARELHDGVNGDLSAIKYKLSKSSDDAHSVIQEVIGMVDQACEQVRSISHDLNPPALEAFSFEEALADFCSKINAVQTEAHVHYQHIGPSMDLPMKVKSNLFRIVQELVHNSLKHANATEINIQTSHHDHSVHLSVEDNGQGFDLQETFQVGLGLKNIQSRVEWLKGESDWVSNEQGTSFNLELGIHFS